MRAEPPSSSQATRRWRVAALLSALGVAFVLPRIATTQEAAREPRMVDVTARRFEFVPATIEARVGEHLRLRVTSEDRTHGFGIEAFGVDTLVPRGGRTVVVEFAPSRAGTFEILCTEDCGRGHDDMKGTLIVKAVPQ